MARSASRFLFPLLPTLLLTATIMLTGAMPERGTVAGREEGDSVEMEEDEYPEFVPDGTGATYSREELMANVVYPSEAREEGVEAKVEVMVYLGRTGKVDSTKAIKVTPDVGEFRSAFVEAAIAAIQRTRFVPAVQNGVAIPYRLGLTIEFALEPDREMGGGREEGDSVEEAGEAYPDYLSDGTMASYSPAELSSNLTYPARARENGVEGRVVLMVYIEKTGEISKIDVLKATPEGSITPLFIEEAMKGVRNTEFTPAMVNGEPVRSRRIVIVDFRLE